MNRKLLLSGMVAGVFQAGFAYWLATVTEAATRRETFEAGQADAPVRMASTHQRGALAPRLHPVSSHSAA